jgi:mannose-6-phosphate isomerase-like protein (cupin superfamily)
VSDSYIWPLDDNSFKEVSPGFRRRILTGKDLMLCFHRIKEGSGPTPYAPHTDNEQFGIILKGQLDFRLGSDQRHILKPGDIYWAPKNCPHGDSYFTGDPETGETWILDVFAPPREDYRGG